MLNQMIWRATDVERLSPAPVTDAAAIIVQPSAITSVLGTRFPGVETTDPAAIRSVFTDRFRTQQSAPLSLTGIIDAIRGRLAPGIDTMPLGPQAPNDPFSAIPQLPGSGEGFVLSGNTAENGGAEPTEKERRDNASFLLLAIGTVIAVFMLLKK